MANAGTIVMKATILPDEIATTITDTSVFSPKDASDKWYYKKTEVSTASTDLIAGRFIDYTAVDDDTDQTAVSTSDKVEFLFIQNLDSTQDIYIVLDGGTVSNTATDAIKIKAGTSWYAHLPNTTVADIHAIGYDGTTATATNALVAALLDDV